ncbi:MAG TPA: hypothetical protein PK718_03310 [Candidatus Methanofastidiosa archaeon]|nr:hypothetical protein [Candidatus Methanofastidiosa archaeon]
MAEEEYELYKLIKDPFKSDEERIAALNILLGMGTEDAEKTLINLANDGYLKFELRNKALEYCFKFDRGRYRPKGISKK